MTWKVLVTCPPMIMTLDNCQERFETEGMEVTAPAITQQLPESQLCEIVGQYDGVIAGDDPFTERVLEAGYKGRLKAIAKWGIGVDAIDLEAARAKGIVVTNTPEVFGGEVADVAVGYAVLLFRHLHHIDRAVRSGEWRKIQGVSSRGKTAGIIGLGSIGRAVARRLRSMEMKLLGHDVSQISPAFCSETDLTPAGKEQLLTQSDLVILTCSLNKQNRHFLNEHAFRLVKKGVFIINVARGPLIKESALLAALDEGVVAGAALDVFEVEPVGPDNPLLKYEQVILGTHNGSNTREAVERVNQIAIDNLLRSLQQGDSKGMAS